MWWVNLLVPIILKLIDKAWPDHWYSRKKKFKSKEKVMGRLNKFFLNKPTQEEIAQLGKLKEEKTNATN